MQPVVAPSRSSHTRSVLARFLGRFSGKGIFTDVTRLIALRTSSRSAAGLGVAARARSRMAGTTDLACWSICEIPPRTPDFFRRVGARSQAEPTVELTAGAGVRDPDKKMLSAAAETQRSNSAGALTPSKRTTLTTTRS